MSSAPVSVDSVDPAPADGAGRGRSDVSSAPSPVSLLASRVKALVRDGEDSGARDAFSELVGLEQRRASRLAYYYLRDAGDADEAVQDAFVKAYVHIDRYQDERPFEVWFTRILVNGCLDRRKARARRQRWLLPLGDRDLETPPAADRSEAPPNPEQSLLNRERSRQVSSAIDRLPDRQRTVLLLYHHEERSTREVAEVTGLSEATVRVHLHRALRRLRTILEGHRETR